MDTSVIVMGLDRLAEMLNKKGSYTAVQDFSASILAQVSQDTDVVSLWSAIKKMGDAPSYDYQTQEHSQYARLFWLIKTDALYQNLVYWTALNKDSQLAGLLKVETELRRLNYIRTRIKILDNMLGTDVVSAIDTARGSIKDTLSSVASFFVGDTKALADRYKCDNFTNGISPTAIIKRMKEYEGKEYDLVYVDGWGEKNKVTEYTISARVTSTFIHRELDSSWMPQHATDKTAGVLFNVSVARQGDDSYRITVKPKTKKDYDYSWGTDKTLAEPMITWWKNHGHKTITIKAKASETGGEGALSDAINNIIEGRDANDTVNASTEEAK